MLGTNSQCQKGVKHVWDLMCSLGFESNTRAISTELVAAGYHKVLLVAWWSSKNCEEDDARSCVGSCHHEFLLEYTRGWAHGTSDMTMMAPRQAVDFGADSELVSPSSVCPTCRLQIAEGHYVALQQ